MKKTIYLLMMILTTSLSAFASNESSGEKVGAAFISGLIFTLGTFIFNWIKSNKNNDN